MERSVCPHCSFRNFSVSKACARCEKPLVAATPAAAAPAAEPAIPRAVRPRPEPASRRTTAPLPAAEVPTPPAARGRPLSMAEGPAPLPAEDAATRIGPPLPAAPPPVQPPRPAAEAARGPEAAARPAAPEPASAAPPAPRPSRPLLPATTWQHALASVLDLAAVGAVALVWALLEMAIKSGGWPSEQSSFLEALALWLHLYAHTARRMALLAVLFALGHTMVGVRTGKTAGRVALGLLLVGTGSGRPTKGGTWGATLWHTIGGTLSVMTFGAGHFWLLVDQRRRTWANLLGRTVVVQNARRRGAARP